MADGVKNPGKGWHGDSKRHAEAGKKGGLATARSRGNEFFSMIGAKGGTLSPGNFKNNPQKARVAGKKGGKK